MDTSLPEKWLAARKDELHLEQAVFSYHASLVGSLLPSRGVRGAAAQGGAGGVLGGAAAPSRGCAAWAGSLPRLEIAAVQPSPSRPPLPPSSEQKPRFLRRGSTVCASSARCV